MLFRFAVDIMILRVIILSLPFIIARQSIATTAAAKHDKTSAAPNSAIDYANEGQYNAIIRKEVEEIPFAYDEAVNDRTLNGITRSTVFNPIGMQEYHLSFTVDLENVNDGNIQTETNTFTMFQSNDNHCYNGKDDTGLVLWGPSVILSQFLLQSQRMSTHSIVRAGTIPSLDHIKFHNKTVMELGCGAAVPSLVIARNDFGAERVIATDFRSMTLAQVEYHAKINNISSTMIETYRLDWQNEYQQNELIQQDTGKPDIILAADVIYGLDLVSALAQTIERFLSRRKDSRLILAAKEGREGIEEFRQLMRYHFDEVYNQTQIDSAIYSPPIPNELQNDPFSIDRYHGRFSIFIYQWKDQELL